MGLAHRSFEDYCRTQSSGQAFLAIITRLPFYVPQHQTDSAQDSQWIAVQPGVARHLFGERFELPFADGGICLGLTFLQFPFEV